MDSKKKAAIDVDNIGQQTLAEVSAADFLDALNKKGLTVSQLTVWPEKKKVELWAEPEDIRHVRIDEIIGVIRNEKKKVEYEKPPGTEMWRDPREFIYEDLLNRLVRDVEARLRR